ncbi:hypothetical protein QYE76_050717 [Lolium multiflorum]|uniref:Aminotransferase-like plant mobile domain-containing protein n=1 Tax=Lolium multiflorum TaxID=4521 RepID=A0AAD8WJG6_LOLMU|nr:hypothetical protein QYE76_050717 [Lolium multiflorum]
MNPSALTALVDRWRPETHTFHLRAGEMAPTLQDVSMILALPIRASLCMNTLRWVAPAMAALIGGLLRPRTKEESSAGASFEWIRTNFGECPEEEEDTRRTYARVLMVEWEPYGSYYRIGAAMADLNHKCTEEARFWRLIGSGRGRSQIGQSIIAATSRHSNTVWKRHGMLALSDCASRLGRFQQLPQWFHENTRIELVKHAYPEEILDDPIQFDEVGQSQHDTFARRGRSTSIASELNFVREEIQKTAQECEIIWEQSGREEKPVGPLRHFIKGATHAARRWGKLGGEGATSAGTVAPREDHMGMCAPVGEAQQKAQRDGPGYPPATAAQDMTEFSSGYALPAGRNSTGCRESSGEAGRQAAPRALPCAAHGPGRGVF